MPLNNIHRNVLLHNVKITCPEISTYLTNFYILPALLFILGGKEISSEEGTTQGDPIAMGMYVIGLIPLLTTILSSHNLNDLRQVAFADDVTGIGKVMVGFNHKIWSIHRI